MDSLSRHPELPTGYVVRPPVPADAEAVAALKRAVELARHGESYVTPDHVLEEWSLPRLALDGDVWLVENAGAVVGYGLCWVEEPPAGIVAELVVDPACGSLGVDELLLGLCEARADELAREAASASSRTLGVWAHESDESRLELYRRHGFERTGAFVRLERDLGDRLETPAWPPGITVAAFRPGVDDAAVHIAYEEGFRDHAGPGEPDFDDWLRAHLAQHDPDDALWLVAWDGDEVAGGIEATLTPAGGYMGELFVRLPWRGRGLARALMLQECLELARRGVRTAYFGVDTANAGAMHLHESVGFRATRGSVLFFEKRTAVE
jgi:mycothiol synthase